MLNNYEINYHNAVCDVRNFVENDGLDLESALDMAIAKNVGFLGLMQIGKLKREARENYGEAGR